MEQNEENLRDNILTGWREPGKAISLDSFKTQREWAAIPASKTSSFIS